MFPYHTRLNVIMIALRAFPLAEPPVGHVGIYWESIARRLVALAKLDATDAARMNNRFRSEIAVKLDSPSDLLKSLDGDWVVLLGKILDSVVSPKTKREHLSSVTCEPGDFPALLAVIYALAHAAPSRMWVPSRGDADGFTFGTTESDNPPEPRAGGGATPESHHRIAERIWYRPQLAMLTTAIWPMSLGLEYYDSTLCHIMNPAAPLCRDEDILDGMVMPPDWDVGVL